MDGIHDMGGMHGFGPINPEEDEPIYHADWEKKALALNLAMGSHGRWNIDRSRFFREQTEPARYLSYNYYEIWMDGLERLMLDAGLVTEKELEEGRMQPGSGTGEGAVRVLTRDAVEGVLFSKGGLARREEGEAGRFKPGDRVRVLNFHPASHTRAPRYLRGHVGEIAIDHGFQVFPDDNALKKGENPQRCYNVKFTMQEVWGADASPRDHICADLWDSYLEAV